MRRAAAVLALLTALAAGSARADEVLALAELRAGRAAALVRHATAPGVGDPAGFRLDDCATQRNLDDRGRAEARALGERLRAAGLSPARVRSSRWCRALETARLMAIGTVEPWPPLDSFFAARGERDARTAELSALLAMPADGPEIFVTHQVNVTALTGIMPASGEVVVIARRPPHPVLARLR